LILETSHQGIGTFFGEHAVDAIGTVMQPVLVPKHSTRLPVSVVRGSEKKSE
jgi:hypothetical protein